MHSARHVRGRPAQRTKRRSADAQREAERGAGRDVGGVVQPHVDAGRGDAGGERVPAGPAAEQRRRAERRGRVPRRERARDRAVQAVVELDVGVLGGPNPPEQRLDHAVREQRLGAHRRREPDREPDVAAARERDRRAARRARAGCDRPRSTAGRRRRRRRGCGRDRTARSTAASSRGDLGAHRSRLADAQTMTSGSCGRPSRSAWRASITGAACVGSPPYVGTELLERAVGAQRRGARPEVGAGARGAHRLHHRARLHLDTAHRLIARLGDDALRLRQVQQLDALGPATEHPLAQQRVDVDAGHALLFPAFAGLAAGLVVGDHELTVGIELEPVDDAADDDTVGGLGGDAQLDAEHRDLARVFHLEVAAEEHLGVGVERRPLLFGELELGELRVGGELLGGPREVEQRVLDRALGRRPPHQVLEREVHERALARRRRRRLGQPLDVGEAERERAARERAHRARRQRSRHREVTRGCADGRDRVDGHETTIQPG